VAIDHNERILNLHSKASHAHTICGDIGDYEVLYETWRHSGGAGTFTCGYSCQPFSRLGDGKSSADERSSSLTKALRMAYYLQAQVVILECVAYMDVSLEVLTMRWEGQIDGTVSIAAILDHLIRAQDVVAPTIPDVDCPMHSIPEDLEETPVMDEPYIVDDPTLAGCLCLDSCTVIFADSTETPVRFHPKCGTTLAQFLNAHEKLVGKFEVDCIKIGNKVISWDHVMEVAQVIVIHGKRDEPDCTMPVCEPVVSPTAEWSQPAVDNAKVYSPPRKVSKFDVGECVIPSEILPDDHSWLDARPLHGLQGNQFLKLQMPGIQNAQQLWSLRHQYLRSEDRLVVLQQQERFWADDEIRFHLHAVVQASQEYHIRLGKPVAPVCVIDPLISSAWLQHRGFDCKLWAEDHPEIKNDGIPIATVVLIGQHWVIAKQWCSKNPQIKDNGQNIVTAVAVEDHWLPLWFVPQGLPEHVMCGAHAMAFIAHLTVGMPLPDTLGELRTLHTNMRVVEANRGKAVTGKGKGKGGKIGEAANPGPNPIFVLGVAVLSRHPTREDPAMLLATLTSLLEHYLLLRFLKRPAFVISKILPKRCKPVDSKLMCGMSQYMDRVMTMQGRLNCNTVCFTNGSKWLTPPPRTGFTDSGFADGLTIFVMKCLRMCSKLLHNSLRHWSVVARFAGWSVILADTCAVHDYTGSRILAVQANLTRPSEFWELYALHAQARAVIQEINHAVQRLQLNISREVVRSGEPVVVEMAPIDAALPPPQRTWRPLPELRIPAQAVRWYGDALVRRILSWFWQSVGTSLEEPQWVSHFQLYADYMCSTGHPGPVHLTKWADGDTVPLLTLRGLAFRQRTRWFVKVWKECLKHLGINLEFAYG
ncbi:unnamed protein product, partial [Cladocopium goreaui]